MKQKTNFFILFLSLKVCLFLCLKVSATSELFPYPEGKQPPVKIEQVVTLVKKLFPYINDPNCYISNIGLHGNKAQDGGGRWVVFIASKKDSIIVTLHLKSFKGEVTYGEDRGFKVYDFSYKNMIIEDHKLSKDQVLPNKEDKNSEPDPFED